MPKKTYSIRITKLKNVPVCRGAAREKKNIKMYSFSPEAICKTTERNLLFSIFKVRKPEFNYDRIFVLF
jgi:hypothetical protein